MKKWVRNAKHLIENLQLAIESSQIEDQYHVFVSLLLTRDIEIDRSIYKVPEQHASEE
jgi:hypothetical protein